MNSALPTIHQRFFRVIGYSGLISMLLTSGGIITAGLVEMRYKLIEDFGQIAIGVAHAYAVLDAHGSPGLLADYLGAYSEAPGLMRICAYDADNHSIARWEHKDIPGKCPAMLTSKGEETSGLSTHIALPVEQGGHYHGMIYVEGSLSGLKVWLLRGCLVTLTLLLVCWCACHLAALWSARAVTGALDAIRRQIECFKSNDAASCPLQPEGGTVETAALSNDIMALRRHLAEVTVPKEEVLNLKHWHLEIMGSLLKGLQHRLSADSPLLEIVNDYTVLMQVKRGDALPPARPLDLARIMDASLAAARRLEPPAAQVNLTVSLQADMPQQWQGQPELLETLFRHLLLIGLKRAHTGFVCVRLRASTPALGGLNIAFEDSGPAIPPWQLRQRLDIAKEDVPVVFANEGISWLLVTRLLRHLGGYINGTSPKEEGLLLEITLPMTSATPVPAKKPSAAARTHVHAALPTALLVEGEAALRARLSPLLEAVRHRAFMVKTHAEMVEWACVLPFSVVISNLAFADDGRDALRKLSHMRQEGVLHDIPFWAISNIDTLNGLCDPLRQAIAELLMLPLRPEPLRQLCARLKPIPDGFYRAHDERLRGEFTDVLTQSLPEMDRMLDLQVASLLPMIEALADGVEAGDVRHAVHGVKSAALNLGYFRLAGLMGQMEHVVGRPGAMPAHNWTIIDRVLRESGFAGEADQNPAQRGATSS